MVPLRRRLSPRPPVDQRGPGGAPELGVLAGGHSLNRTDGDVHSALSADVETSRCAGSGCKKTGARAWGNALAPSSAMERRRGLRAGLNGVHAERVHRPNSAVSGSLDDGDGGEASCVSPRATSPERIGTRLRRSRAMITRSHASPRAPARTIERARTTTIAQAAPSMKGSMIQLDPLQLLSVSSISRPFLRVLARI